MNMMLETLKGTRLMNLEFSGNMMRRQENV